MSDNNFTGDKKAPIVSPLAPGEKTIIKALTPKFPSWIQGYHLTLLTIPWSAGMLIFAYLAAKQNNYAWLWLSSLMLFLQWFTDCFDGALGRYRDTGIPKWGYYMDHFLDFVFMSAVFLSYSFLFEGLNKTLWYFLTPLYGCLMVSSFLAFSATGKFKITYLGTGPTEIRLFFIILNTIIFFFGTTFVENTLVYVFTAFIILISIVVYRTQKQIWAIDMNDVKNRTKDLDN